MQLMIHRKKTLLRISTALLSLLGTIAWPALVSAQPPRGAECDATELLPSSIVACAEIADLGSVLETVLNHPLRAKLEAMPAYDGFMASGARGKLQMGLRAFEASIGKPWQEALDTLTDRGVTVALDASDGGIAILVNSSDAELLERFRGFILALRQMQGATAKQGDYRGFMADLVGDDVKLVRMHDWMLVTNNSELGKSIIDQYLDRDNESLASNETYLASRKNLEGSTENRVASAFLDLKTLRDAGVAKNIFNEKIDNLIGEVAVGGILANLRHTPYLAAQFHLQTAGLSLELATPHDREWEAPREYFFGDPELASAAPLLQVPNRVFALSTHRDLSQMWLRAGDLLTEKGNDQLAVADTTLTTLFSGRDFGEDILGSLDSDVRLVGMEQDFTDVLPQPAIKLPAFALQLQMKDAAETKPELRRIFQSFVGFLNVVGAMNGQPPLDLGMESIGEADLVTATYVPDRDERENRNAKIQFNFSPTVAFDGDRIIIASSTPIARKLIEPASDPENAGEVDDATQDSNTAAQLDVTPLQRILESNRSQLVANSMLKKGHGKAAAEAEVGLLLNLLGFFRDVRLNLDVTDSQMALQLAVDVDADAKVQK